MLKRLLYTSDPYEPNGTIGIYETEEQKENIVNRYLEDNLNRFPMLEEKYFRNQLFEEEIIIGEYYP